MNVLPIIVDGGRITGSAEALAAFFDAVIAHEVTLVGVTMAVSTDEGTTVRTTTSSGEAPAEALRATASGG